MRDLLEELSQEIWGEPNYSDMYSDIANAKCNKGNYEHAIVACQQSLQINPNGYYPLYLQGKIYYSKEDYPLSIYYFSKALKLKKTFYLFLKRGISKYELKNYEDAIDDFKEAILLNAEYTPSYYYIAKCKYALENYAGAIDDLNSAIKLSDKHNRIDESFNRMNIFFHNSGDDLLYSLRGQCKYEMDHYKNAIEDFNKAIEINSHPLDFFYRAECKYELDDYEGALYDINKSLKLSPKKEYALDLRAYIKFEIEDNQGAIEDLNELIELTTDNDEYYAIRGKCKLNQKQYKGAIEDFNKAIDINSENKESINLRNQCIQKLDNISDALIQSLSLKII